MGCRRLVPAAALWLTGGAAPAVDGLDGLDGLVVRAWPAIAVAGKLHSRMRLCPWSAM